MKVFYVLASIFIFINNAVFSTVINDSNKTTPSDELTNYNLKGSGFKSKLDNYLSSVPNYLKRKLLLTKGEGSCGDDFDDFRDACKGAKGLIGNGSCNGIQACYNKHGNVGDGSCNGSKACDSSGSWNVGNGSCNTDNACDCQYPKGVEYHDGSMHFAQDVGDNECNTPDECCKPYVLISEDELEAVLLNNTKPIIYAANPDYGIFEIPSSKIQCTFECDIKTCAVNDTRYPYKQLTVVAYSPPDISCPDESIVKQSKKTQQNAAP